MSYTHATGKSDKDLVSYQSVRGADIKAINTAVREVTPISQLHAHFSRPVEGTRSTDSVDNTIQFLHATDFLTRPADDLVEPIEDQPFDDLAFELQVCHHLKQQPAPQDHFMELHRVLVEEDTRLLDKDLLLEDLKGELGQYPFDWNIDKVKMWYDMMGPLGLVSVHDNQKILTGPSPRMVYDLLEVFSARHSSARLREALDWVEENFFYCYAKRGGASPRVHAGLSETLETLVDDDALELDSPSDATHQVAIPSMNAEQTSKFTLGKRPQTPAYEYPLNSHQMEDSQ